MKRLLIIFFVITLSLFTPSMVGAQIPAPEIIEVNRPISAQVRASLLEWLADAPPSTAHYYAVTYTQQSGLSDTYVSMVGLTIQTPDAHWSLVEDPETGETFILWADTVLVYANGQVDADPFDLTVSYAPFAKQADILPLPQLGAGGGSYVRFPWQPSKAVQYGIFGAHTAAYDTDGDTWLAVDLISGTDMGSGAANDGVYSSVGGSISYVCDYGDSVAVKVSGNGDSFLYAHLLPNANLEIGHSFSAGEYIGALKHGSFSDQCGWAAQQEDHWHLHWGFVTSGSSPRTFRAEGCQMIKSVAFTSGIWECGDEQVLVLGYLYHYGNISINPDTGEVGYEGNGSSPSFWNYFIGGIGELFDSMFTENLPEHDSGAPFLTPIMTSVKVVLRVALVLFQGNFNLVPSISAIMFVIAFKLMLAAAFAVISIVRVIKSLPMVP